MEDQLQQFSVPSKTTIAKQALYRTPDNLTLDFPTIMVSLSDAKGNRYEVDALLDSGATGTYVSSAFVAEHSIPTRPLPSPMYARNADDTLNAAAITHEAKLRVEVQGHSSIEWYYVTDIGTKAMIIGMTWLRCHNPAIDWRTGTLEFTQIGRAHV